MLCWISRFGLPLQDAKELLYRLYRAGFVGMQEIPRTADHAPSRTLYTWRVDAAAAAEKLAADLYKAALNVRLRFEHELNQQSNVSFLPQPCLLSVANSNVIQSSGMLLASIRLQ